MSERNSSSDTAAFPPILEDGEIDRIAASQCEEYGSLRRKDKPDPWPLVEQHFPRVAAVIREIWGTPELDAYFTRLVIDDRHGRQGFPPVVLAAILEIAWLHGQRFAFGRGFCPWETDVSQTKWWKRE